MAISEVGYSGIDPEIAKCISELISSASCAGTWVDYQRELICIEHEDENDKEFTERVGQYAAKLTGCIASKSATKPQPETQSQITLNADFTMAWGNVLLDLVRKFSGLDDAKDVFFDYRKKSLWIKGTQSSIAKAEMVLDIVDSIVNKDFHNAKGRLLAHIKNGHTNRTALLPRMNMQAAEFDRLANRLIASHLIVKVREGRSTHYRKAGE